VKLSFTLMVWERLRVLVAGSVGRCWGDQRILHGGRERRICGGMKPEKHYEKREKMRFIWVLDIF
jgi:hypothetical protein